MPTALINLSPTQAEDLGLVCDLGSNKIEEIVNLLNRSPRTIRMSKIREIIAAEIQSEASNALARILFGLSTLMRRNDSDAKSVVDGLTISIVSRKDLILSEKWEKCKEKFLQLLECESVQISAKASDLSYDVQGFCHGVRILTDIRPVFNEAKDDIIGSVIMQTLRIEYLSAEMEISTISIALDSADIDHLLKACNGALQKSKVSKMVMEKSGRPEISVPGEEFT